VLDLPTVEFDRSL